MRDEYGREQKNPYNEVLPDETMDEFQAVMRSNLWPEDWRRVYAHDIDYDIVKLRLYKPGRPETITRKYSAPMFGTLEDVRAWLVRVIAHFHAAVDNGEDQITQNMLDGLIEPKGYIKGTRG